MVSRRAAAALRGMGRVMVVLDLLVARSRELAEGAAANTAGNLGDEGTGAELSGRFHAACMARRRSLCQARSRRCDAHPLHLAAMTAVLLLAAILAGQGGAARPPAPAVPPPTATTTMAPQPLTDWPFRFQDDDYPSSAMRADEQGTTRYRVEIGTDGRVARCTVTGSSGSASLDSTSCRVVARRARFTPARDSAGNAIPDLREGEVTWRIGGDD